MQVKHHPLAQGTPGTRREIQSLHYGPVGGRKALLQAALHADEVPGMLVAQHLREALARLEQQGRLCGEIVLLPACNPIGLSQWQLLAHQGRFDANSGENFNRHYAELSGAAAQRAAPLMGPDAQANVALLRRCLRECLAEQAPQTELESLRQCLLDLALDADVVLDLHCDCESVLHLYSATPLRADAERLARHLDAELCLLAEESGDHPFDEACSQVWWRLARHFDGRHPVPQACFAATVELRGYTDVSHALAARDAQGLLAFLAEQGFITQEAAEPAPLRRAARPLQGSMPLHAPHAGLVVFARQPGDEVRAGDLIVEVIDPISGQKTALLSPVDGLLYAREQRRYANAGLRLAKVAGEQALRSGKLLSA
ncbi:succinylglutamate desuccinylase/aspartoacylase family protein [Roseateles sp.]|jgi:predicted deacylase|uniref:succinylglutamate desuccinylase/aspartoacylase family protein n=1 Tax=Roseateles sp. TaxID=1971397 RepID=UPI0037C5DEAA